MAKKELWLKNNTESDVHLSDLGVKVGKNKTINVYAYNPYITEDKVRVSLEDGSLRKRLDLNLLTRVKKPVNSRPHTLDHIKSSTEGVEVVKTKTAVVVDTKEMEVLNDEDLGEIADYGLGDLGHENTTHSKTEDGSVVVKQKQDATDEEPQGAKVSMGVVPSNSNMSGQSVVAMTEMGEKASNPVGPMAESHSPDQSFTVVNPPKDKPEKPDELSPKRPTKIKTKVSKDEDSGGVVVEGEDDTGPKKTVSGYGVKVATKTDNGAVVMEPTETAATEPAKATKKKSTKKKAKKKTKKKSKKAKTSKGKKTSKK